MTDSEILKNLTEALKLIKHQRGLIEKLQAHHEAEVTRLQGAIDELITERLEREFVVTNLKRELAEQVEVNAQMWEEVKAELPKGV